MLEPLKDGDQSKRRGGRSSITLASRIARVVGKTHAGNVSQALDEVRAFCHQRTQHNTYTQNFTLHLTLPYLRGGLTPSAETSSVGPVRNPEVPEGYHNLLEVLANLKIEDH